MKNTFKQEKLILRLSLNPGLALTGFRTEQPGPDERPPHRELRPLLFSSSVWVLLRPTELIMESCVTWPRVYRPYPRRLESLTICRHHYKGSTFSSVNPECWSGRGLNPRPPARLTLPTELTGRRFDSLFFEK